MQDSGNISRGAHGVMMKRIGLLLMTLSILGIVTYGFYKMQGGNSESSISNEAIPTSSTKPEIKTSTQSNSNVPKIKSISASNANANTNTNTQTQVNKGNMNSVKQQNKGNTQTKSSSAVSKTNTLSEQSVESALSKMANEIMNGASDSIIYSDSNIAFKKYFAITKKWGNDYSNNNSQYWSNIYTELLNAYQFTEENDSFDARSEWTYIQSELLSMQN